jgi:hypothetical protein
MCNKCNSSATICGQVTECSCPVKDLSTDCVQYTGDDLLCSGIKKGTILTEFLKQLDDFICNTISQLTSGYVPYSGSVDNVNLGAFDLKVQNQTIGVGPFIYRSLIIGEEAAGNANFGYANMAIGYRSMYSSGTGSNANLAIGIQSMMDNVTGEANTAVGINALKACVNGKENTVLGREALSKATNPRRCSAIGNGALVFAAVTEDSTANGFLALAGNKGNYNTAMGSSAAWGNGIGFTTGTLPGSGEGNSTFGAFSMQNLANGDYNTAIGHLASQSLTNGDENVSVGYKAAQSGAATLGNTAIGSKALSENITGDYNTVLGYNAQATNVDECVVLGRQATATGNNQFVVGSATAPAGMLSTETNTSTKVWNVIINGVPQKILLA